MITVLTGFLAGLIHVFSGPDHLAAVAPLTGRDRQSSWRLGLHWGIGHASGVVALGVIGFLFRGLLPLELLSSWAERLVGVLLVAVGIWGVSRAMRNRVHSHPHTHGQEVHEHFHVHWPFTKPHHSHGHAAFGIGIVHGVAGGSHLLGVIPAMAFPSWTGGLGYLGAYAIGTVLAMGCFTGLIGLLFKRLDSNPGRYRLCLIGSSIAAMGLGIVWLCG